MKEPTRNTVVPGLRRSDRGWMLAALTVLLLLFEPARMAAGEIDSDEHTLLLLRFNNSLNGVDGESPSSSSGFSYAPGVSLQAAFLADPNDVTFSTASNLDATQGSLEFWIQPQWDGNDGQDHYVVQAGVAGGILIGKDGGNFWRIILNRYGAGGSPEVGTGFFITNEWSAGEWHHAAFTWSSQAVKVYVDGELRASVSGPFSLPEISDTSFHIGSDNGSSPVVALLDELRISSIVRSHEEIQASYLAGPDIVSLDIQPQSADLLETWWLTPTVTATTTIGSLTLPSAGLSWSSTDESVASVDAAGRIVAVSDGVATLTGSIEGVHDTVDMSVEAPLLPPVRSSIAPFLATPAAAALWEIPVVILRYLPTTDGINVDPVVTGISSTLADLEDRIDELTIETKFMLEEGTRFRGYQSSGSPTSLGYRVLEIVTIYEKFQTGIEVPWNPGIYFPDYEQILTRADAEEWVNTHGVREFWIWGWHYGDIEQPESNMSSPLTGDISNSIRAEDLPIFDSTYTVYGYNYDRTSNESVHNHGHQLEAVLSHANNLQDGNTDLFWHDFVGQNSQGSWITGRCGWTHMPPNTTSHYDYWNMALAESDCSDWTPAGTGATQLVNADTWGTLVYPWPEGPPDHDLIQHQFYIWWMQNMPGRENGIPYSSEAMTNWWAFTGDWDGAISRGVGLHGDPECGGGPTQTVTERTFANAEVVEGCQAVTTDNSVVVASSDPVVFRAGIVVSLADGFSVLLGASFVADVDPILYPF